MDGQIGWLADSVTDCLIIDARAHPAAGPCIAATSRPVLDDFRDARVSNRDARAFVRPAAASEMSNDAQPVAGCLRGPAIVRVGGPCSHEARHGVPCHSSHFDGRH